MRFSLLIPILATAGVAFVASSPGAAQLVSPAAAPTDADELAAQMRQLASNPLDLGALIHAGELALKLDDPTAASGFFARAERIDPRNARIRAGQGGVLLAGERPG
ncbi:MAG: sporulation protein, partial [Pseudomonadota bacterium]|nr:sporulation protein [Pseudomonadota bacterium]